MTGPLHLSFEVACPPEHAFRVWTARIASWWPADHTVTGSPATVVIEDRVGGRIYERAADGSEHDWGAVTAWDPPTTFSYRWHLGRDPTEATEVEIRFTPQATSATRVDIEHRGWERLGDEAAAWRDRNRTGWETLLPHFAAAIERGAT